MERQYPTRQLARLMLQALRANPSRQSVAALRQIPAPVGGLNAKDALSAMPPTDAVVLDNFFPEATYCELRRGYASHATGCGAAVQTLMTYFSLDGDEELFAVADNTIWDVTTAGSAVSSYTGSIVSSKWQWLNFTNTAGTFLLAFNGQNTPLIYAGSAWSTNSITGSITSSANLISGFQYNERIFLCEKNTLNLWYLASQAISGAATKLPLGGVFNKGGSLIGGGTFSFDTGIGVDDYLVVVTTNGEAAMYSGTNPASDFSLKGVFNIGVPVGNRPLVRVGGDLIVITTSGAVPMSAMIANNRAQAEQVSITAKIQELFNRAVRSYSGNFGWEAINYPKGRFIAVNIPEVEGVRQRQYVQNLITGAWCRFTGLNGNCWGLLDDDLYFGGNDGTVYHADYTRQDNGSQIEWDMKTAFNHCGSPGQNKFFKALRPFLLTSGTASFLGGVNVDYDDVAPTGQITATPGGSGVWSNASSLWSVANWAGTGILVRDWMTVGRIGTVVAARFKGAASNISVQCNGFDLMYEKTQGSIY